MFRSPLKRGRSSASPGRDEKPKTSLRRGDAVENGKPAAVSTYQVMIHRLLQPMWQLTGLWVHPWLPLQLVLPIRLLGSVGATIAMYRS